MALAPRYNAGAMDSLTERAVLDYHRLLNDEPALQQELLDVFADRMRAAKATFGERLLCPFVRPHFVSRESYDRIRAVCRGIFAAIEKVEARLGPELWDRVDVTPEERELMKIEPGYRRTSPTSRLDSFLTDSAFQFVELNAESPAGAGYADMLAEVFLGLAIMKRFQERWKLTRFETCQRLLDTLLGCYHEAGGRKPDPTIAIVDYDDVPTRAEHHMLCELFERRGYPALVCDPRELEYSAGRLRFDGKAIDIVYRRLLVNELLDRIDSLQPLLQALRERAVVLVNPLRCKPIHKKAIFAVLTDDELQPLFTEEERAAIRAHVPWTRRVSDARTQRDGRSIDLLEYARANREQLVLKPNDEYGGKGVFIGWEMSAAEWDVALSQALTSSYVVQQKVDLLRQSFPTLEDGRIGFRDLVVDLDPFVFNGEVEGCLTRLSGSSLANVTSGGGQVTAFLLEER